MSEVVYLVTLRFTGMTVLVCSCRRSNAVLKKVETSIALYLFFDRTKDEHCTTFGLKRIITKLLELNCSRTVNRLTYLGRGLKLDRDIGKKFRNLFCTKLFRNSVWTMVDLTEFKNQGWNWNAKYDSPLISGENIHCHGV